MRIHHLKTTRQYSESACKVNRLNGGGAVLNGTEDLGEAITIDSPRSFAPDVDDGTEEVEAFGW